MKSLAAALSVLVVAGCSTLDPLSADGGTGDVDAGPAAVDAGTLWTMEVHADTLWSATASAGDAVQHQPAEIAASDLLPATAHYEASAAADTATARATFDISTEERAIHFTGHAEQVSPGAATPSGASGSVTDLRVCLEALGAKAFRRTFECTGTVSNDGRGGAAIRAVSGAKIHCETEKYPDHEQPWTTPDAVTEIPAAPSGMTCFDTGTTVTVGAGGGVEGAGSATADGAITVRFEAVY